MTTETREDETPIDALKGALEHYNEQALSMGAALKPETAWRYTVQVLRRVVAAIDELGYGFEGPWLDDDQADAVLGLLAAVVVLRETQTDGVSKRGHAELVAAIEATVKAAEHLSEQLADILTAHAEAAVLRAEAASGNGASS